MSVTATRDRSSHSEDGVGRGSVGDSTRSRRRRDLRSQAASLLLLAVLIAAWQLLASSHTNWRNLVSTPSAIYQRAIDMATDGTLWDNLYPTLKETLGGLLVGLAVGVLGGFIMAKSKIIGSVFDPYVIGINGVPRVALAPFFVVWFGIGINSKILLSASIVFVGVLFNVRSGVEDIDPDLANALRSMGASRRVMIRQVVIPSLTPWLLASLKVGTGMALTGSVVGELVGADSGLGWYITNSLNVLDMTGAMTALILMAILGMLMYYIVLMVERRVLAWRDLSVNA